VGWNAGIGAQSPLGTAEAPALGAKSSDKPPAAEEVRAIVAVAGTPGTEPHAEDRPEPKSRQLKNTRARLAMPLAAVPQERQRTRLKPPSNPWVRRSRGDPVGLCIRESASGRSCSDNWSATSAAPGQQAPRRTSVLSGPRRREHARKSQNEHRSRCQPRQRIAPSSSMGGGVTLFAPSGDAYRPRCAVPEVPEGPSGGFPHRSVPNRRRSSKQAKVGPRPELRDGEPSQGFGATRRKG
jgi:hypothetical protein